MSGGSNLAIHDSPERAAVQRSVTVIAGFTRSAGMTGDGLR
jgi:hypothetical protein